LLVIETGMIERDLDRHNAGIGDETMRRLHPIDAAVRRRHANRTALVTADCHVDLAGDQQCRAARGRAARRISESARIMHGRHRIRMAPAREAVIFAVRLAYDGAAGIQDARDDGGIDVRRIAFQRGGTVHHWHACKADVIF
jgi:hypothetical protein